MNNLNMQIPIISILIFLPLVSGIFVAICGNKSGKVNVAAKYVGILSSLVIFLCSIYMVWLFDYNKTGYQFEEHYSLVPSLGLEYHLGIDGISLLFVALTAFLVPLCFFSILGNLNVRVREFLIAFLFLESFVIACFASVNLLLFYIFFEAMLIPMYIIIGCYGSEKRVYAAFKFFLYTFFGSVFLLIALITIYIKTGSFDMKYLVMNAKNISTILPHWIWLAIFIGMAVKVPMVPFHTWLPAAHVQAPTSGSVILAGILLKVGGYGMIRVLLQILPSHTAYYAEYAMYLSVIAIIYGSYVATAQTDMKKMIAYSSVAHMGFVTAGIFSMNITGLEGALLQMVSHGLISSGLFLVVGMLYDRMHTKEISSYGGVAARMPILATFFMILVLSSVSLPGTSGFIAELLCLMGIFKYDMYLAMMATTGVILGAIYMLSLYKRIMFGEITNSSIEKIKDIEWHEISILLTICILIMIIGIQPEYILSIFRLGLSGIV